MEFKSGFITIVGKPNVGKSTLINRMTGEKISIVTDKCQTTRNAIKAIITGDNYQMIFIDTPGIIKPKNMLDEYMVKTALNSLVGVDVALLMVEGTHVYPNKEEIEIMEQLKRTRVPVFLVINKIDIAKREDVLKLIPGYEKHLQFSKVITVSALTGEGTDTLLKEIEMHLPAGPKYFPDDT
ncbi:MAG: GTPase Era, partial [Clostridiaceae bacterium]|nr:GTPase Era [Clostridiaceae bacterium]